MEKKKKNIRNYIKFVQCYKWCAKSSKITIYNFLINFQAPFTSVVGEIKDASWSRDVTSVIFSPGLSDMEKLVGTLFISCSLFFTCMCACEIFWENQNKRKPSIKKEALITGVLLAVWILWEISKNTFSYSGTPLVAAFE